MVQAKKGGDANTEPAERREQILASAGELFATKGVTATTVREIGNAVGLLSGSLYHYFDSKDAMVEQLVSDFLQDLTDAYPRVRAENDDPRSCLAGLIRASFHLVAKHPYACHIYQHDFNYLRTLPRFAVLDEMAKDGERSWLDLLREGAEQGQFRTDIEPIVFYRFSRDAIFLSVRWYRPGGRRTIDDLADSFIAIAMEGYAVAEPVAAVASSSGSGRRRGQ
jgi:TetR/AcrR family transcriptional regulator, cholesterol catabolism regulator